MLEVDGGYFILKSIVKNLIFIIGSFRYSTLLSKKPVVWGKGGTEKVDNSLFSVPPFGGYSGARLRPLAVPRLI